MGISRLLEAAKLQSAAVADNPRYAADSTRRLRRQNAERSGSVGRNWPMAIRHWSVSITWLIRILTLFPAVCIQQSATPTLTLTLTIFLTLSL